MAINSKLELVNNFKYIGNKLGFLNLYRYLKGEYTSFVNKNKYREIKLGFIELPSKVTIELTNKCNLNCKMCFQENNLNLRELNINEIDKLFKNLGPRCKIVNLTGGEIFIRHDIFDILDLIKFKYKKRCYISTNGTLINKKVYEELCKYTNIIGIQFSLDGPERIHNLLRASELAFKKTLDAIYLTKHNFVISVNCIIMRENLEYIPVFTSFLGNIGVRNIVFSFEMFSTRKEIEESEKNLNTSDTKITTNVKDNKQYGFNFNDFIENIENAKVIGRHYGTNVEIAPNLKHKYLNVFYKACIRNEVKLFCSELLQGRVNFNGDAIHCHLIRTNFGNLLKIPFEDVWFSNKFIDFRRKLINSNLLPICERCCKVELISPCN